MTKRPVCSCRQLICDTLNDLKSPVTLTASFSAMRIKTQSWQNAQSKWLLRHVPLSLSTCPGSLMVLWSFKPHEKHLAAFSVHKNFSIAAGRLPRQLVPYCTLSMFWAFSFFCLAWKNTDNLQPFVFKLEIFTVVLTVALCVRMSFHPSHWFITGVLLASMLPALASATHD